MRNQTYLVVDASLYPVPVTTWVWILRVRPVGDKYRDLVELSLGNDVRLALYSFREWCRRY